jgi:putative membrane protein
MRGFLARLFITAFGLWMADMVLPGLWFDGVASLWIAAFLLGVVNAFVRPVVILLTFPITLFTLGLFLFIVNGAMVMLVAWIMPSFHIEGLGWAVLASIVVGLTGWTANAYVGSQGKFELWRTTTRP